MSAERKKKPLELGEVKINNMHLKFDSENHQFLQSLGSLPSVVENMSPKLIYLYFSSLENT